ncbi:MAG: 50S ribosomal protein L9 [Planctomycetes bacterium]|nr:50S ribosomal protein L9 [Planctomycetota bacterium]
MQLILLENIEGLGRKGDQVMVRDGYGRNYLLPERKALLATADTLSRLTTLKKKFAAEEAVLVAELKGVASKLEGFKIELEMRATAEGHLFGSVSAHVLAVALKERGHTVSERDIRIKEPIKTVGTFEVAVHLHADVKVSITVVVDAEGKPAGDTTEATEGVAESGATAARTAEGAPAS